jgi:hypothetical protein
MIGNVKGRRNFAYKLARKAEAGAPGMAYFRLTAYDAAEAGIYDLAEIEDAKASLPEAVFNELYLCIPSDDQGNPFGLKAIDACLSGLSSAAPAAFGIDLAKSVDWTVVLGLDKGGRTSRFNRFQKPWQDTINSIKDEVGTVPALVDSTGVGDPVVEILQSGAPNYEGYKFTSQSKQQLMEGLAVAIQQQQVYFPEGPIAQELREFEYEYTRTGVRYSAPEGFNDDCVCALALAVRKMTMPVELGRVAPTTILTARTR